MLELKNNKKIIMARDLRQDALNSKATMGCGAVSFHGGVGILINV